MERRRQEGELWCLQDVMGLAYIATITDLVTSPYRANILAKGHMFVCGIFLIRGTLRKKQLEETSRIKSSGAIAQRLTTLTGTVRVVLRHRVHIERCCPRPTDRRPSLLCTANPDSVAAPPRLGCLSHAGSHPPTDNVLMLAASRSSSSALSWHLM